ncbi:hypothetical protein WJX72_006681 [[Myrmecia] bisecta]|uniref:Uncharacterized protein n=1 Tax=[Myrmecia] bisecta TaxID=41462 RepID=A0AAW1QFF6_9CHLO
MEMDTSKVLMGASFSPSNTCPEVNMSGWGTTKVAKTHWGHGTVCDRGERLFMPGIELLPKGTYTWLADAFEVSDGGDGLWSAIASTGSDEDVLEPTTKLSTKERCTADVCFVHKSIPLAASDWEEPAAPRRITVNIFNTQPLSGFSFELVDEDCQRVRVEAAEGGLLGDLQDTFVALGHNLVSMVVYGQGRRETCLHNAAAQQGSTQLAVQVPKGANKTTSADAGAAADVNEPAEGEDGADAEESYDFEYDEETGETVEASAVKRRPEDEDEELPAAATKANASASTSEDSVSEALFRDAVPLEGLPLSTTAQTPKSEVKGGFFSTTKEKIFGGGAKDSPAPTETPAAKAEPKPAATVPNVDELDLAGDRSTDTEESESANGESEDMLAVGSTKPPWRAEKNAGDVSFGGKGGKTVSTAASDGMTHSVADTEAVEYVAKKNAEKGGDNLEDAPSNQMRGSPAGLLQAAGQSFINIAIVAGLVIALVVGSVLYFKATSSNPARARVIEIGGGGKGYSRVSDSSGADRPENWDNDWDNDNWDDPDTGRISQRRVKSPEQARRRQDWNNDF